MTTPGSSDPGFLTLGEMKARAKALLTPEIWDYLDGGSDGEVTLERNRAAFSRYDLMPRILRDVREIDLSTTVMGRSSPFPFFPTAIGSLDLLHPDGATGSAVAAAGLGGTACVGVLARPGYAEIVKAAGQPLMLQLYVRGDESWIARTLGEAEEAGCHGVMVTVDSPVYGRRERDLVNRFSSRNAPDRPALAGTDEAQRAQFQAAFDWRMLERLRAMTNLPLGLKGVMVPEDAIRAVDMGVDCIYVSNHGGRQLDSAPAALEQLPAIASAVGNRAEIVFDSGIMRGTDVVKALGLGATSVGLGKLQGYALAAGGTDGIRAMLAILCNEVRSAMAMMGAVRLADIASSLARRPAH